VFRHQAAARFQLDNQLLLDEQIGEIFAEDSAILVINRQRVLLLNIQALFTQPMRQSILVDFLQMPMPVE
jgi:hypothetical protein